MADKKEGLRKAMDKKELQKELEKLGVTPPYDSRAAIYLKKLKAAKEKFNTFANNIELGENPILPLKSALKSDNLINELAKILDIYIIEAINADLQTAKIVDYEEYFRKCFFSGDFETNVEKFFNTYKIIRHALDKITEHFCDNIEQACRRIIGDKSDIEKVFFGGDNGFSLMKLIEIKSSGSDFHKGGKQVLKLTFTGKNTGLFAWSKNVKLVYKPSDVEADCLLVGDSSAINKVANPIFMERSLAEIINDAIHDEQFIKIPTYRILPRNYGSALVSVGNALPIRNSYGYIEYLDYNMSKKSTAITDPKSGSNDCLVYSFYPEELVPNFYRLMGQWTAIACIFSIIDMHIENVRVNKFRPILIDLECSLCILVEHVSDTSLFYLDLGGIDGEKGKSELSEIKFEDGRLWPYQDRYYQQNRLWKALDTGERKIIKVDWSSLIDGYSSGISLLTLVSSSEVLNRWLTRLTNVVIRHTPYATEVFQVSIERIYKMADLKRSINDVVLEHVRFSYDSYKASYDGGLPKFIIWTIDSAGFDLINLDIPVFYNRIGTIDIMNSQGTKIALTEHEAQLIGRGSYFPEIPIEAIKRERILALSDPERCIKILNLFRGELIETAKAGSSL